MAILATNITEMTACQLSQAIHAKHVSCVEVMQAYLQHIHAVNPTYNALISLRSDEDCLRDAASKDTLLAQGKAKGGSQGWMHGFPQAPKDLTATAGLTMTLGFRGMANNVPAQDSVVVARMRAAGSILIGKTNTPEFGLGSHTYNRLFGATCNAFDTSKSAGGSSGGAAVALAKQLLPVADGSDMMGSLRNPAAWNGVYGLRPSMGLVPYGTQTAVQTGAQAGAQASNGVVGDVFFQQLGIEGPMGRCAEDMAQLLAVQAGYDPRTPLSRQNQVDYTGALQTDLKGKRVAWLGDMQGHLAVEPSLMQGLEHSLKHFTSIGCVVQATNLNIDLNAVWQAWLALRGMTVAGNLSPLVANLTMRDLLKPEALWEYEQGQRYSALDIYKASVVRSNLLAAFLALFETADYLALPATQCMPFEIGLDWPKSIAEQSGAVRVMDTYHRWMESSIYATLAGLPAMSVPAGFIGGLPFGVQIIGKPQGEWALLQLAYAWQQNVA